MASTWSNAEEFMRQQTNLHYVNLSEDFKHFNFDIDADVFSEHYVELKPKEKTFFYDLAVVYALLECSVRRKNCNMTAEELTKTQEGCNELKLLSNLDIYIRTRIFYLDTAPVFFSLNSEESSGVRSLISVVEKVPPPEAFRDYILIFGYLVDQILREIKNTVVKGMSRHFPEYEHLNNKIIIYIPPEFKIPSRFLYFDFDDVPVEFQFIEKETDTKILPNYKGVQVPDRNRYKINQSSKERRYKNYWLKNNKTKCLPGTSEQYALDSKFFSAAHIIPLETIDKFLNIAVPVVEHQLNVVNPKNDIDQGLTRAHRLFKERIYAGRSLTCIGEADFLSSKLRAIRSDKYPDYASRAGLNWVPGNLFYCSVNRYDDPGNNFEYNCRDLIGDARYNNLLSIYSDMNKIIEKAKGIKEADSCYASDAELFVKKLAEDFRFVKFCDKIFQKFLIAGDFCEKPRPWDEKEWKYLSITEALKEGYLKNVKNKDKIAKGAPKEGWVIKLVPRDPTTSKS